MSDGMEGMGSDRKYTVRIVGFEPGCSQDAVIRVLSKLYKKKQPEEIRKALARIPLVLTRNATEQQARKIRQLLEELGVVLEISFTGITRRKGSEEKDRPDHVVSQASSEKEAVIPNRPVTWVKDRRAKPRVHPGFDLKPMGIWDMVKRSLVLLKENLWVFFMILLIPSGLSHILSKGLEAITPGGGWGSFGELLLWALVSVIAGVAILGIFIWAEGAIIFGVSEVYLGHHITVLDCYKAMKRRLGGLILTMVFVWVFVALGTLLLVFPGIVLFFRWLLVDKVVVIEGLRGKEARNRSRELMRFAVGEGYWGRPWVRAGAALAVASLMALVGTLLLMGSTWIIGSLLPEPAGLHLTEAMGLVSEALATAFLSIVMVIYYYDLRVRKEGLDPRGLAKNL